MLNSVDQSLISTFGKGVDYIEIDETNKDMLDEINERISRLMLVLTQEGGNLRKLRRSRFIRRINKNKSISSLSRLNRNRSINKRRIKLFKKISKRLRNKRRSRNFRL
jgi:hypothetical protein